MFTTRIAPSPTGMFHLGTARTAYFCWLAARASGGEFVLRIDDTDEDRNQVEAVQVIYDSLDWLGLHPDRVYVQSQRRDIYSCFCDRMIEKGSAEKREDGAIMLVMPPDMPSSWNDTIAGEILVSDNVLHQVSTTMLMRPDGMPTYNFASIIDDMTTGVNWVIRGHDHISNTPKQIAIWHAVWTGPDDELRVLPKWDGRRPLPRWSHVGLIFNNGKKLSKRDAAASLLTYREQGYNPDALLTFMLRLGWSPRVDDKTTKLIERDRAIELFLDGGSMRNQPAGYDAKKLANIQSNYEKKLKIPPEQWVSKRGTQAEAGTSAATPTRKGNVAAHAKKQPDQSHGSGPAGSALREAHREEPSPEA
jgi:glutamyl/glutaminyl-tRNA synthetase